MKVDYTLLEELYDDLPQQVKREKVRKEGTLNDLAVYGTNRKNGAIRRMRKTSRWAKEYVEKTDR